MKKLTNLIFASAILLICSCVKVYDCSCGKVYSSHDLKRIEARTQSGAKKQCEEGNSSRPDSLKCVLH
jgi:hypothetical protein